MTPPKNAWFVNVRQSWSTEIGIMHPIKVDVLELANGMVLVITGETVFLHACIEDFENGKQSIAQLGTI